MSPDEPPARPTRRGPREIQEDVEEELRFHLEMRAADLEAAGADPASAREEAMRRLGDRAAIRRACVESDRGRERTMQRQEYLGDMVQDLTHGLRQLRARPLFTLAAVLTLAVGIGATTAEIGVRIALGARPADIVGLIVGQGMWLVVPGVLLGLAGALYLTRFLEHMLYHVHATDPVTFAQVAAVMVMVAVAGALVPAVRAAVTDPVLALRQE